MSVTRLCWPSACSALCLSMLPSDIMIGLPFIMLHILTFQSRTVMSTRSVYGASKVCKYRW